MERGAFADALSQHQDKLALHMLGSPQDADDAASGETVLLVLGPTKGLVFGDFPDCFLSVNVLGGAETGLSAEWLEALADGIDFAVLKDVQAPDMRGDALAEPGPGGAAGPLYERTGIPELDADAPIGTE